MVHEHAGRSLATRPGAEETIVTRSTAQERATDGVTRVRLANGPLMGPVLWRVVSMVLARADWPLDRLDDALLVCDALCAHAPAYASDGRLTFSIEASGQEAELRVLDLTCDGAERLVKDAMLPVVGNVLERIADRVSVELYERGERSQLVLVFALKGQAAEA
jgi:serine/threonine-protein kinase RsbW